MVLLGMTLLLACAAGLAAQEAAQEASQEAAQEAALFDIEAVKQALPVQFKAYGKAIWAPLVYRAVNGGFLSGADTTSDGAGIGSGAGPGWDDTLGAAVGLDAWGSNKPGNIGFEMRLSARLGNGALYTRDNMAYLWAKPFDEVLKLQLGLYRWDVLRGKIGGISEAVGGYGGDEDSIFQRLESDTFGAMLILTPPAKAPDAVKGLTLFSSFGVSGGIDPAKNSFAAATENAFKYIFSTPHAGIAYQHEAFGLARFQFIAGNYHWGNGGDWYNAITNGNTSTSANGKIYYPTHSKEAARLELAFNLTSVPNLNLDLGFGLPLPVTVVLDDLNSVKAVGPTYRELGIRSAANYLYRIANEEGDKWQPPIRAAAGIEYKLPDLNLGFRFRTKLEFGESVRFYDDYDDFKGGFDVEAGLDTSYTIGKIGTVSLDLALRANQNDSFNGNKKLSGEADIGSLSHNGVTDLGLGAFFTRQFSRGCYIKAGVAATLPIGGDRYDWSPGGAADLEVKEREAYKDGNFIVAIPIIIEMNLF
jgi:hypothetical protein